MRINRLETHDRLEHLKKQDFDIAACCQDLIDKRPFGPHPFYIFAHQRTDDDGFNKRLIWQPRLTKPKAQINSMLFKAYPGKDIVKIIWMIPIKELWDNFKKDQMTEDQLIFESIEKFRWDRKALEAPEDDDLSDAEIDAIYREISLEAKRKKHIGYLHQPIINPYA